MSNDEDVIRRLHPEKMVREFNVSHSISAGELLVYFVVMAKFMEPKELASYIPDDLRRRFFEFVRDSASASPGTRVFVGGRFEAAWDIAQARKWMAFFSQDGAGEMPRN